MVNRAGKIKLVGLLFPFAMGKLPLRRPVVSAASARGRSLGQREERAGSPAQEEAPEGVGRYQQGNQEAEDSLGCPRTATGRAGNGTRRMTTRLAKD
jgi:hypothetical protein